MRTDDREFTVVIEKGGDGHFVGSVPELQGCHSQAKSIDVLMERMREVIELCLAEQKEPVPASTSFVGVQRIRVKLPHVRVAPY
ncbi:MAG: type II toxin-antitoxin system HicB family antitoxin [Candidatus Micrarchaeota archaeon]